MPEPGNGGDTYSAPDDSAPDAVTHYKRRIKSIVKVCIITGVVEGERGGGGRRSPIYFVGVTPFTTYYEDMGER